MGKKSCKNVKGHLITGLDRPLGIQEVEVPRNFRKSAYRLPPAAFTPRIYPCYSFLLEAESTPVP